MSQPNLPAIFAAYCGAEILFEGKTYKHDSISFELPMIELIAVRDIYNRRWVKLEQCKLRLIPLSKISDADAIELVAFAGWDAEMRGKVLKCEFDKIVHNTIRVEFEMHQYRIPITIEVIDFLRSKGYNCGYGNLVSLIDARIAVDKTV